VTSLGFETKARGELERRLGDLLDGEGPVLVGPWLAEIGPELVYWIPFLRWVVARFDVDPSRLTAISRGGVASWYADVCASYADIFDVMSVDAYRKLNAARWAALGGMKQSRLTHWDRAVLKKAARWNGRTPVLHPAFMFRFLRRFWKGGLSLAQLLDHVRFRTMEPPPLDVGLAELLPEDYVVVAFYFRDSFRATPENRALVRKIVAALAEQTTVVLLDTEIRADEHMETKVDLSERVLMPLANAEPSQNLRLQTAVAARARAWVGTYGGRTHIAPSHGVDCVSFTSDPAGYLTSYLDAIARLTAVTKAAYTVLDVSNLQFLAQLGAPRRVQAA